MNPPKWYERGSFFSFSMNNFFRLMTQFCSVLARISKLKAMRSIFGRDGGQKFVQFVLGSIHPQSGSILGIAKGVGKKFLGASHTLPGPSSGRAWRNMSSDSVGEGPRAVRLKNSLYTYRCAVFSEVS